MFKMCFANAWVPGTQQRTGQLRPIQNILVLVLFMALTCFGGAQSLSAQGAVHWTEADGFRIGYQMSSAAATLAPNEQFSIKLYLETNPGIECLGVNLNLRCSPLVEHLPGGSHSIPPGAWLGSSSTLGVSFNERPGCRSTNWSIARTDNASRSGAGWVLSLNFVVGNGSIQTNRIVERLSGGLIIVENIDMKQMHLEEEVVKLKVFPNPFTDRVQVVGSGKKDLHCRVIDQKGQLLYEAELHSSGELQLQQLPSGMYFLQVATPGEERSQTFRIVKR